MRTKAMRRITTPWISGPLALLGLGFLAWFLGFPRQVSAAPALRIAGAYDLAPLGQAAAAAFNQEYPNSVVFTPTTSALADLKAGRVDAILLGREPSAAELVGLETKPVAYDAVCILVDQQTYEGGELFGGFMVVGSTGVWSDQQPTMKYGGLKNLSLDNLRGLIGSRLGFANSIWTFSGPDAGYYTFEPYADDNLQPIRDLNQPGLYLGSWVWNDVQLSGDTLPPGMFDTQAALLQKLGLPETVLDNPHIGFVDPAFNSEELLISRFFSLEKNQESSSPTYKFSLEIASRRVTLAALQHHFALRALSINGIDPLADPQVIYSGSYPLSRRIHLISMAPLNRDARLFLLFLESDEGQQLISEAGYLPLPQ